MIRLVSVLTFFRVCACAVALSCVSAATPQRRLEVQIRVKEDELAELKGIVAQKQAKLDQVQEKVE